MSRPSGRSTPTSKWCGTAKPSAHPATWTPTIARIPPGGYSRRPRPSGSSHTIRFRTPCSGFGSDATGASRSVRIFPIGSSLLESTVPFRGLKGFGGIPRRASRSGAGAEKLESLEFGRFVLELFRWNVASGSANGARFGRRRGDVGRLTTRLRALPIGSVPSAPAGTTRDRERDDEQTEGQPRAQDGGKPLGRQGGQRWRWGVRFRRTRRAGPEFRSPPDRWSAATDALRPVQCGHRHPLRLVPVINHVERAEQPIHVSRPGDPFGRGVDRETPRRAEFVLDAALRAELRCDCIDRPRGVVYGVRAVILESASENLRGLRLESEAINVHGCRDRQERTHAEGRGRASIARRGTAVGLTRRPSVPMRGRVVIVVDETVHVHLHRVSDDAPGDELPEADRAADARQLRAP